MARTRVPKAGGIATLVARSLGIVASAGFLGHLIYEAAAFGGRKTYWLSIVAAVVAIIVDGWEVAAVLDRARRWTQRAPARCLACEDVVVLCLVGSSLALILFSDWDLGSDPNPPRGGWPWEEADSRTFALWGAVLFLLTIGACTSCCILRRSKNKLKSAGDRRALPPTVTNTMAKGKVMDTEDGADQDRKTDSQLHGLNTEEVTSVQTRDDHRHEAFPHAKV